LHMIHFRRIQLPEGGAHLQEGVLLLLGQNVIKLFFLGHQWTLL